MNRYVIGVDGGGTKTNFALIDFSGNILANAKSDSTNYQAVGGKKLREEILKGIEFLTKQSNLPANKIDHIFLGLAGAGRESDRKEILALFHDTEFNKKITVDSDAMAALAGAFATGPGIILIAGTGAICFGKNSRGKIVRAGGWGYLLGDEGSGYFIGREAIIAALKDFDGRGEKTSLKDRLTAHFRLNSIDQIIPQIYQNRIDRVAIADLAPIVFDEARNGDSVAAEIIRRSGKELGLLTKAVAQRLNFEGEEIKVALIGSIFKQREMLIHEISKELYEISWNVEISDPLFAPEYGAALLAIQKSGAEVTDSLIQNLQNSIQQREAI